MLGVVCPVLHTTFPFAFAVTVMLCPWQAVCTGAVSVGVVGIGSTDTVILTEVSDVHDADCTRT